MSEPSISFGKTHVKYVQTQIQIQTQTQIQKSNHQTVSNGKEGAGERKEG